MPTYEIAVRVDGVSADVILSQVCDFSSPARELPAECPYHKAPLISDLRALIMVFDLEAPSLAAARAEALKTFGFLSVCSSKHKRPLGGISVRKKKT